MIIIGVKWPEINKDTVRFFWSSNEKNPLFKKNNFYFKYEGLNIEKMPKEVFWNTFLSVMIPIFDLSKEDVLFIFPESIPSFLAETWIDFHSAANITIFPLSDKKVNLNSNSKVSKPKNSKVGILFGGGKDSSYAFSVLSEIYGIENTLLISYVFGYNEKAIARVNKRRENMVLKPLKEELNVKVQRVISDIQASLKNPKDIYRTNIVLFTGTVLPVILKYDISLLTHSNEFISFTTGYYDSNGSNVTKFNFRRSRPEYDNYLSERSNSFFKTNLSIKNINYFISGLVAFKLLAKRYPHVLKHILMCETIGNPNKKWCKNCDKCATYVLYSLYTGYEQGEIDIDYFFSESPYIKNILESTKNLEPNEDGNYPWHPSIGYFGRFSNVMASIDPEDVRKRTSLKGFNNFMTIRKRYGNKKLPIYESLIIPAFEKISPPYAEEIKKIITTYCPELNNIPEYLNKKNIKTTLDYSLSCEIPKVFKVNHGKKYLDNVSNTLLKEIYK
ncbi:MAG: hypothetical protein FH751_14610 [Firmicutes bacterium]|nr:hypothetical protein [Bacillota bacterium]